MNDYLASDYHTGASVNRSFYVDDGTNAGYAYHGSALLDSGASINLFGVHANASLINPRRSPARVAGYSDAARRHADKFGRVFMCVTDGTRRTDEGMAELYIHTMTDMNDDLISASEMIKRAGYKSILQDDDSALNGFFKSEGPVTIDANDTLNTGRVHSILPATYDPQRHLWFIHYTIASTPEAAYAAAQDQLPTLQAQNSVHLAMASYDGALNVEQLSPFLDGIDAVGGSYTIYDEINEPWLEDFASDTEAPWPEYGPVPCTNYITTSVDPQKHRRNAVYDGNLCRPDSEKKIPQNKPGGWAKTGWCDCGDFQCVDANPVTEAIDELDALRHAADILVPPETTDEWKQNDASLTSSLRSSDRKLTKAERHRKCGHIGHMDNCVICIQTQQTLRRVYPHADPIRDNTPGRTWHFDMITWSVRSYQGMKYTIGGRDENCGAWKGCHIRLRSDSTHELHDLIIRVRSDPELSKNPALMRRIYLDPAGEWGPGNRAFNEKMIEIGVQIIYRVTSVDKRQAARAENTMRVIEVTTKRIMLQNRLEIQMWQYAVDYCFFVRDLVCIVRKAAPDGHGPRPLQELSMNNVSEYECDRRLFQCQPPGTPALVTVPHGAKVPHAGGTVPYNGKGSDIHDVSRVRWARALYMSVDHCVWQCPWTKARFRSKNYIVFNLPQGLNIFEFLGIASPTLPRACFPLQEDKSINELTIVVQLEDLFPSNPERSLLRNPVESLTARGTSLTPNVVIQDKSSGLILEPDGDDLFLRPTNRRMDTTGELVKPLDNVIEVDLIARQLSYLINLPQYFVGRRVFRRHDGKLYRGVVQDSEERSGVPGGFVWGIQYDDNQHNEVYTEFCEDFDAGDMEKYAIRFVDGTNSAVKCIDEGDGFDPSDDEIEKDDHVGQVIPDKSTDVADLGGVDTEWYTTSEDLQTFVDVCDNLKLSKADRVEYFAWLKEEFKIGNNRSFKTDADALFFPSPFTQESKGKAYTKFKVGTRFPRPEGRRWRDFLAGRPVPKVHDENRDIEIDYEHAAEIEAYCMHMEYKVMVDNDPDDWTPFQISEYLCEIADSSADATNINWSKAESKLYTDERGIPIAPKSIPMLKRRKDGGDPMWHKAVDTEMDGIDEFNTLEHNLTRGELTERGILPHKGIVPMKVLLDTKLKPDQTFDKAKARCVAQGHPGHVQKGTHYTDVFAASPGLEESRLLQMMAVMLGLIRWAFDVSQAYLHGEAAEGEEIPVSYPPGLERYAENGEPLFALLIGNLYGIPPAGRNWQKLLYNWMLTEMGADSEDEWIVSQMLYAPCMFKILINNRVSFVVVHTDDCDGASQDPRDGAAIRDAFNARFGVKDVDPKFMLGNQRDVYQVDGEGNILSEPTPESITVLRHHQTGYVDKLWENWGHFRKGKSAPSTPFPEKSSISPVDRTGKPIIVSADEHTAVLKRGYRELIGGLLWPIRNAYPSCAFGISQLCRCMQTPSEVAWTYAIHMLHHLYSIRDTGIEYHSDRDAKMVCYYDSSHMDDRWDYKSQYCFVIYIWGGPVMWKSKKHQHVGHSAAEDEYMAMAHAARAVKFMRSLIIEMGYGDILLGVDMPATPLIGDNRQAKRWGREDMITDGNRFIEREYFIVREYVKMDAIEPLWQMGTKNPSDLGTKAVTKQIYDQLINKLTGAEKQFNMPPDEHKLRHHEPFDDENAHYCGAYTWDDSYLSRDAPGKYSISYDPAKFYSDVMSSSHENTDAWKMSRGPIDMANGYSTSGGVLRRERYYRSATYPCRSATYPWDDSLPIGAEYPRHVRGVTEIGTSDLVRGVSEEGIEELDDGNQFYEYTDEYRYRREVLEKQDREAKM